MEKIIQTFEEFRKTKKRLSIVKKMIYSRKK